MANRHNPPVLPDDWRKELRAARRKRKLGGYRYLQDPFKKPVMVPEDRKPRLEPARRYLPCRTCGGPTLTALRDPDAVECRRCRKARSTRGVCQDCGEPCRRESKRCLRCSNEKNRLDRLARKKEQAA